MATCTNLASKLSRGICGYLVSAGINQVQVYPQFTSKARTFANGPIVTALIYPGSPDVKFTGDLRFKVGISIKGNALDNSNTASEADRVAFDAMVGKVYEALTQSDDDRTFRATTTALNAASNAMAVAGTGPQEAAKQPWIQAQYNADMSDFAVTQWTDAGCGAGKAEDCHWEAMLLFEATACESAIE